MAASTVNSVSIRQGMKELHGLGLIRVCYLLGTLKKVTAGVEWGETDAVFGVSMEMSGTPKSQAMPLAFSQRSITDSGLG